MNFKSRPEGRLNCRARIGSSAWLRGSSQNSKSVWGDSLDLDSLQSRTEKIILGVISQDEENKYPFTGGYLHIKFSNYVYVQFIFGVIGRSYYRRYVSGKWENWYTITTTVFNQ